MRFHYLVAFGLCLLTGCSTLTKAPRVNPWRDTKAPSAAAEPRVVGDYSAGCLDGGMALPPSGEGYRVMRPERLRYFGHPDLLAFVTALGADISREKLGFLHVGDLAQPRGGPTDSTHVSHQTGLDADLWFELDEGGTAPSMLRPDGEATSPERWGKAQIELLKLAVAHPEVDRIFVNPAIKRELCVANDQPSDRQWLHKLRPWYGHDDHFHVRLQCPASSPECRHQAPPPPGDGCDETLNWWFSDEAKQKAKAEAAASTKNELPPLPTLPDACAAVLAAPAAPPPAPWPGTQVGGSSGSSGGTTLELPPAPAKGSPAP